MRAAAIFLAIFSCGSLLMIASCESEVSGPVTKISYLADWECLQPEGTFAIVPLVMLQESDYAEIQEARERIELLRIHAQVEWKDAAQQFATMQHLLNADMETVRVGKTFYADKFYGMPLVADEDSPAYRIYEEKNMNFRLACNRRNGSLVKMFKENREVLRLHDLPYKSWLSKSLHLPCRIKKSGKCQEQAANN